VGTQARGLSDKAESKRSGGKCKVGKQDQLEIGTEGTRCIVRGEDFDA